LRYQCERAESDYFARWRNILSTRSAIQRDPLRAKVLDFARVQEDFPDYRSHDQAQVKLWETLMRGYADSLASNLFDDFLEELYDCQHILVAFGAPRLDPRLLSRILGAGTVAVFLNVGVSKRGFVAPATVGYLQIDLANAHKRIPETVDKLRREFAFESFGRSALHELIKIFVRFISRAVELKEDGKLDEATIHLIVALEILFAERRNIAESTTERAAALVSLNRDLALSEISRILNELYEKRSRYVHQGRSSTSTEEINYSLELVKSILETLLRLQKEPIRCTGEYIKLWLEHLDFAAKSLVVGRRLDPKERDIVLGF
jgi:hypothetical protein